MPAGPEIRPTSDRVREAMFSTIESIRRGLGGARVLDLYAGSGAVGLEALSRGAAHALLVEGDQRAARVIRANVKSLGLGGADLVVGRAEGVLASPPGRPPYDVVVADPPYATRDAELCRVLETADANGWLAADVILAVERSSRGGEFTWPPGFVAERSRRYGETVLWYGRRAGATKEAVGT